MNTWKRLSLTVQYLLLLILIVLVTILLTVALARDTNISAKLNEARTVTDMVENIGAWASQYRGMWARREATDTKMKVGDFLNQETGMTDGMAINYHQKNPALIQREISQVTEKSDAKAKFRMTSDKFMNPDNAPNRFEMTAMENIRSNVDKVEYYEVVDNDFLYARRIIAAAACLKCHDTPAKAPQAVREKYPALRGYGYKEGEVIGVTSVKIPLENSTKTVLGNLSRLSWIAMALFFSALFLTFYMIRKTLISPLRQLRKFADDVRDADTDTVVVPPVFVAREFSSKNEIHQLNQALKALHNAIKLFVTKK